MLDRDTPANIITYLYPNTNFKIRVHEHTDTKSLWIVYTDICNILNKTNPSLLAKLKFKDKDKHVHKIITNKGKQSILFINKEALLEDLYQDNLKAIQLADWLSSLTLVHNKNTKHVFKEPVLVEKACLDYLYNFLTGLKEQGII